MGFTFIKTHTLLEEFPFTTFLMEESIWLKTRNESLELKLRS